MILSYFNGEWGESMGSKHSEFYKSYIKELEEKAGKAVKEAQKKTFSEYFEVADKKINELYKEAVDEFYQDYSPSFYKREENLYNLLQTKCEEDGLTMSFDPSKLKYRNGYAESSESDGIPGGLYDLVFRQGWHGGAMVRNIMVYPIGTNENGKPRAYDGGYENGYYKPYSDKDYQYSFGIAKRMKISPLDNFKKRIAKYQKNEYQREYEKIWNKNKANIKIDI